ncbi:Protein N-acetyltransferase, RimJ/RimL family [Chitinophaga eiseniae]|uniref:Protein N-acetyltransferase, RimJ/RimL family n=1 Tax=Chitinophaga eiseniae TaxID=634771 RepID=A0A1T4SL79_9BACT|nr:GNAT family N-acetyltransferase [Chitinophaga eiseniae]SKA28969.1 Protein N-acetyltransferase, RimJ/RimL family [Chitinophaga eiseniae]
MKTLNIIPAYAVPDHPLGMVELWPMDLRQDTPEIYRWVTQPYARYWGMTTKTYEEVLTEYTAIHHNTHAAALIGKINGKTAFLCECYDPAHDLIGRFYDPAPGDVGMHILIGPVEKPVHGFTWQVFSFVMDFLFENPSHNRVVVEPDAGNEKIHRLNKKAGFTYVKEVQLPHKTAALAFCTRQQYSQSKKNN